MTWLYTFFLTEKKTHFNKPSHWPVGGLLRDWDQEQNVVLCFTLCNLFILFSSSWSHCSVSPCTWQTMLLHKELLSLYDLHSSNQLRVRALYEVQFQISRRKNLGNPAWSAISGVIDYGQLMECSRSRRAAGAPTCGRWVRGGGGAWRSSPLL